ncbi:hypothetical protein [Streptomyces sp. NPDC058280]|uniref:hypothetical protein n=1 Tax=Streptomyces sp. NPDC058280 TaxID=3346419 RepID=UPI0036E2CECF
MDAYDEMTNADVMSGEEMREYDQDAEARLDAQDEERWATEETAAGAHGTEEPCEGPADGVHR